MKVSFTASFWSVPQIAEIYRSCDTIFTTNWDKLEVLRDAFGHKINLLPHGYCWVSKMIQDDIKESHPEAEFIVYSDVSKIVRKLLKEGDWSTHMYLLSHYGWKVNEISLYDEEGIDGLEWFRDGESFGTGMIGVVPESVRKFYM